MEFYNSETYPDFQYMMGIRRRLIIIRLPILKLNAGSHKFNPLNPSGNFTYRQV
jgi:hypothetical protein